MNSHYVNIDRLNYAASIDPVYAYRRCYKHIAMGVATDYYVQRYRTDHKLTHEELFDRTLVVFHARLQEQMFVPMEIHLKSKAYQKAKRLLFERIAKLFREEDTPYAKDMTFKAELILATQFSGKTRDKKNGSES